MFVLTSRIIPVMAVIILFIKYEKYFDWFGVVFRFSQVFQVQPTRNNFIFKKH